MDTERVLKIRDDRGLTQKMVANLVGCSRSTYAGWELHIDTIPLKGLINVANALRVNIDYLVDLSNDLNTDVFFSPCIDKRILGKKIRTARKKKNLEQSKLANRLNTTQSVISAYETGKTKVSTSFLIGIAKITDTTLTELLDGQAILQNLDSSSISEKIH